MKITIGEWKTRDGRKAIVAAENDRALPSHRMIGWIDDISRNWNKDGSVTGDFEFASDLIAPWSDPVPWDWSTTPPWINWIAMWKDGDWFLFDTEPLIKGDEWDNCDGISSHYIPKSHAPKWSGDWKLSKTMRPGYKEVK